MKKCFKHATSAKKIQAKSHSEFNDFSTVPKTLKYTGESSFRPIVTHEINCKNIFLLL